MLATPRRNTTQSGFTLVEVLAIAPVILLVIATFVGIIIGITGEVMVTRTSNAIAFNTQNALDMIEEDIYLSNQFLATNSITPIISPQGYNNGTQAFANASTTTGTKLVLRKPALNTAGGLASERRPVRLANTPAACDSPAVGQNDIMYINIIYFVREGALWKRTLMPANYDSIGCTHPSERPSCHPSRTNAICVARDMLVLNNVSDFTVSYYSGGAPTTPLSTASNPGYGTATRQNSLNTADSARVELTSLQRVSGRDVTYSGTVRSTRVNSPDQ